MSEVATRPHDEETVTNHELGLQSDGSGRHPSLTFWAD